MANTIEWSGKTEFQNKNLEALEIGGVEAGQIKSFNGLTFMQVFVVLINFVFDIVFCCFFFLCFIILILFWFFFLIEL